MQRFLTILLPAIATSISWGDEVIMDLPTPHYHQEAGDPAWLAYSTQFHGHLGPWAIAGIRLGMAGRLAVKADGYFDIDVTVIGPFAKPPKSCFLDGLQVATGATWGKRNIRWEEGRDIVVQVKNTRSGKVVEIKPSGKLMELITSVKPSPATESRDDQALEALARKVAVLPESQIAAPNHSSSDTQK